MTSPAILYPDATSVVIDYLRDVLNDDYDETVILAAREPNPFPVTTTAEDSPALITVRRVGGTDSIVIDRSRIDLQVWAASLEDATDLANLVRAYMLAMPGVHSSVTVYAVTTFSGPSLIWDADRDLPRFLLTFEVAVRGTAL